MAFNHIGPTTIVDNGAIDCQAGEITQSELDNLVVSFDLSIDTDFSSGYLYLGSESGPDALILRMQANGGNLRLTLTERENYTDSNVFSDQDIAYTLGATAAIRVRHEPDNTYTVFVNDTLAATGVHANYTLAGSVALHFGYIGAGSATYSDITTTWAVLAIGNDDTTTAGTVAVIDWGHGINTVDTFVCPPNFQLSSLNIRSAETGSSTYTFEIGVYDITDGADGASLVYAGPVEVDRSVAGVYSTTELAVDLSAYEGRTLAIAHSRLGFNGHRLEAGTMPQSAAEDFTLDDPFVQASTGGARWAGIWADVEPIPAIDYVGGETESGYSSTATITHGLTILEGDFVLAYVNRDNIADIENVTSGEAWSRAKREQPIDETADHAVFHTVAGASFPATLNFQLSAAADYQVIIKAFRSNNGKQIGLASITSDTNQTPSTAFVMGAANGAVLPENHVSVIFGGKDRQDNTTPSNTVDNGYTGVVGTGTGRASVAAHKISNIAATITGPITVANTDNATPDDIYSMHVVLREIENKQPRILGYEVHTTTADGSFGITVPDTATGIFITVAGYSDGGAAGLVDELSLVNNNSLAFTRVVHEAWYGAQADSTQVDTLFLKSNDAGWQGVGAQTIYHSAKNDNYSEGHNILIWYVKDFDLDNPIIDTDHSHGAAGIVPWDSALTGVTASDMHILPVYRYNGGFTLDINDQTELVQLPAFSGAALTLAYKYGVSSMQVQMSTTVKTAFALRGESPSLTTLVGEDDLVTYTDSSEIYGASFGEWVQTFVATASGPASKIKIHLNDWNTTTSAKLRLRDASGNLLDEATIAVADGVDTVSGVLSASANIVSGQTYQLSFTPDTGYLRPYNNLNNWVIEQVSASTFAVAEDPLSAGTSVGSGEVAMWVEGVADAAIADTTKLVWNVHAGTPATVTGKTINNTNGATLGQTFAGLLDYNDGTNTGFDLTTSGAITADSGGSSAVGDAGLNQAIFEEGGYVDGGSAPSTNTITIDCPVAVTSLDLELFHNTSYGSQTDLDVDANGVTFEAHSVTGNTAGTTIVLAGVVPNGSNQVVISFTQNTSQYVYGNGLRVFNVVEGGGSSQSINIGTASETDSAEGATAGNPQSVITGSASETDSAQSATPVAPITVSTGTGNETDDAQGVNVAFSVSSPVAGYAAGDTVQITVNKILNSLTCSAGNIALTTNNGSIIEFIAPEPPLFGDQTLTYNESITFTATAGSETATFNMPIQPRASELFGEITSIDPAGIYADDTLNVGDFAHVKNITGDIALDVSDGTFNNVSSSSIEYALYDGVWSDYVVEPFQAHHLTVDTGTAGEVDGAGSANPVTPVTVDTGTAGEVDGAGSANPVTPVTVDTGTAGEVNDAGSANPVTPVTVDTGTAGEVDGAGSANPVTPVTVDTGTAGEVDGAGSANPVTPGAVGTGTAGEVSDAGSANPVTPVTVDTGTAGEVSDAGSASPVTDVTVDTGTAGEVNDAGSANPVTDVTPVTVDTGTAGEVNDAGSANPETAQFVGVGVASEVDDAGSAISSNNTPIITLIGGDLEIAAGESFVDPGITASDSLDGDITELVITRGVVNTWVPGSYTVTYSVINSLGVSSGPYNRSVTITGVIGEMITVENEEFPAALLRTNRNKVHVAMGRDNSSSVTLLLRREPVDISQFTRFELKGLTADPIDSELNPGTIAFGSSTGQIVLRIGSLITVDGEYQSTMIGYGPAYPNGIVLWDDEMPRANVTFDVVDSD